MPATFDYQQIERMAEAVALVRVGIRPSIAELHTGVSRRMIRRWYRQIHGVQPTRGPLPSSPKILRTQQHRRHAAHLLEEYERLTGGPSIRIDQLLQAHEDYQAWCRAEGEVCLLSATDAWVLARDMELGNVVKQVCPTCERPHYSALAQRSPDTCPYCPTSRGSARIRGSEPLQIAVQ